jgi:DNA uptake protein ComE-like DNA-binding protein
MRAARTLAPALLTLVLVATPAVAQVGKSQGVVDPNLASETDLRGVPHLTAPVVTALLARRPFLSQTDLDTWLAAQGLSPEQRREAYARIFIALNLNAASRDEILLIPGSGPRVAREFLEYRPYRALAQFTREMGKYWDATEVARLEQYVFVPVNLNSATDDVILTIPGVGPRMLREFKEYRPWTSAEQFRREIGKYVSEKEVARLERYVTW